MKKISAFGIKLIAILAFIYLAHKLLQSIVAYDWSSFMLGFKMSFGPIEDKLMLGLILLIVLYAAYSRATSKQNQMTDYSNHWSIRLIDKFGSLRKN